MVNALIISNNIYFVKKLLDEVSIQSPNINFNKLSTNKLETLKILGSFNPDIIFLDESMKKDYNNSLLNNYKNIIITLVYKKELKLVNQIAFKKIHSLIEKSDLEKRKFRVIKELEYIGYKFKYKGTNYLLDTILQIDLNRNSMVDNLQGNIYPIVANKYNKTVYNIKSSINKATDCMYYECDAKRLENYFHIDTNTKPTIKQVVFTVANKI